MLPRFLPQASRAISKSYTQSLRTATRTKTTHISLGSTLRPLSFARRFSQNAPLQAGKRPYPRMPQYVVTHRRWDPDQVAKAKPLIQRESIRKALGSRGLKICVFAVFCSGTMFYMTHLETVPVSGRRRFNYISEASIEEDSKEVYQAIMQQVSRGILPDWDKRHQMVVRIMKRLIPASGLTGVAWEIHVVNSPERNAFVIPGGKVFVFTGLFDITKNEDGMAAVLGHEIAHNQAKHMAETMSGQVLLVPFQLAFFLIDAVLPFPISQILGSSALQYGISLPASRTHESEADFIGLLMMARACYDPRAAVGLWQRMEAAEQGEGGGGPQFLSTHPSNRNRIGAIKSWLPQAETARNDSRCSATMQYVEDFQRSMADPWALFK